MAFRDYSPKEPAINVLSQSFLDYLRENGLGDPANWKDPGGAPLKVFSSLVSVKGKSTVMEYAIVRFAVQGKTFMKRDFFDKLTPISDSATLGDCLEPEFENLSKSGMIPQVGIKHAYVPIAEGVPLKSYLNGLQLELV